VNNSLSGTKILVAKITTMIVFSYLLISMPVLETAKASDWVTYRYDNARSGVTEDSLIPPLSLKWVYQPTHAPRAAWMKPAEELERMHFDSVYHVTVADGNVYYGSSVDNQIYALNADTGEVNWNAILEGPIRFAPTIWKDRVYVGSDDGYVYCLNSKDGKPVWRYRAGPSGEKIIGNKRMISLWPVRTSVLVDNGVVYFAAGVFPYEGIYICALRADDGTVIWKNDTIGDRSHELAYGGISPQSYLVASDDVLYVPSGRAMPAAFDRESGEFLYYCSSGGHVGGTWALVADGELIAGVGRSGTPAKVTYDGKTGRRKGDAYAWFPGIDMVLTADIAYTLSTDGIHAIDRKAYPDANKKISALRKERQELAAILTDLRGKLSQVTVEAELEGDMDSQVDKISAKINGLATEEEALLKSMACKWQYSRKDLRSIILADNMLFAGGQGTVVAVNVDTGEEAWNAEVDGVALGLAATDGSLFISTDKGPIYCFHDKTATSPGKIKPAIDLTVYDKSKLADIYSNAAEKILQEMSIKQGYCLILDCDEGQLAFELARRSELKIIGIEDNSKKIQKAREKLNKAGLYGDRVVIEQWDIANLPDYFANLIVSDAAVASRKSSPWSQDMFRVLKPYGGVAYVPEKSNWTPITEDIYKEEASVLDGMSKLIRGKLKEAGSWSQLYGNPENTACSSDLLVKAPLGVLWFGEPGPENMVERHARSESPVAIDGRLFIQGAEIIMAYDAYNGTLLWERRIPGAIRVRVDVDGGNLVATKDGIYVAAHDKCYRLDPATGETMRIYELPSSADGNPGRWGYITSVNNVLYGTTATSLRAEYASYWKEMVESGTWKDRDAIPPEYWDKYDSLRARYPEPSEDLFVALHREGALWNFMASFPSWASQRSPKGALTDNLMSGNAIFAMDTETGDLLWMHHGERIANISTVFGDNKIFFTDTSVTAEQREKALNDRPRQIAVAAL